MEINAVFEGGGVRGIALAGAAAGALDAGYTFHRTVETSAGALVAALLAAGYDAQELEEQVAGMDWPRLLDPVPYPGSPSLETILLSGSIAASTVPRESKPCGGSCL